MSVVIPHKAISIVSEAQDKKAAILKQVGDLSGIDVMYNAVLVAQYVRPNKIGSIIRPDAHVEEDVWQGKVGLVLKLGPNAFEDDAETQFHGQRLEVGEWCVFKVGDAWQFTLREWPCRLVPDSSIRLRTKDPNIVL